MNSIFRYFLTFERYFKVWEYQNRRQHEKIPQGLILKFFRQVGTPRQVPGTSLGTPPPGEGSTLTSFPPVPKGGGIQRQTG